MNVVKKVIVTTSIMILLGLWAVYSCWLNSYYTVYSTLLFGVGYLFCILITAIDDLSLTKEKEQQ